MKNITLVVVVMTMFILQSSLGGKFKGLNVSKSPKNVKFWKKTNAFSDGSKWILEKALESKKDDIVFSPDGNYFAETPDVGVWDIKTGKKIIFPYRKLIGFYKIAFNPYSKNFLSVYDLYDENHPYVIMIWRRIYNIFKLLTSKEYKSRIRCVKFSHDGKYLALAFYDKIVIYEKIKKTTDSYVQFDILWKEVASFKIDDICEVNFFTFGSNNTSLIYVENVIESSVPKYYRKGAQAKIKILEKTDSGWDNSSTVTYNLKSIDLLIFNSKKSLLAFLSDYLTVKIFKFYRKKNSKKNRKLSWKKIKTIKEKGKEKGNNPQEMFSLAFNTDGTQLITGHDEGLIKFWDLQKKDAKEHVGTIKTHDKFIKSLAWQPRLKLSEEEIFKKKLFEKTKNVYFYADLCIKSEN